MCTKPCTQAAGPVSITVIECLLGLLLCLVGVIRLAGDFKPIRVSANEKYVKRSINGVLHCSARASGVDPIISFRASDDEISGIFVLMTHGLAPLCVQVCRDSVLQARLSQSWAPPGHKPSMKSACRRRDSVSECIALHTFLYVYHLLYKKRNQLTNNYEHVYQHSRNSSV